MVEVMEDGVVGIGRHAVHLAYRLRLPRGEYQQRSLCARLESLQLWFPVAAYRLFLKVDKRIAALYAPILYDTLSHAYAWRDDSRSTLHHHAFPLHALAAVGIRVLVGRATVSSLPVAEHLHLPCPAKEEQIAEGGVVPVAYAHVQASAHELWASAADDGAARVIGHIAKHGGKMARVDVTKGIGKADGVVVVIIPERLARLGVGGVVLGTLAVGEAVQVGGRRGSQAANDGCPLSAVIG